MVKEHHVRVYKSEGSLPRENHLADRIVMVATDPVTANDEATDMVTNRDRISVNRGAIALGHPISLSGARIVFHLGLEPQRRGAAALCGGGGQGNAVIIRVPSGHPLVKRQAGGTR